MGAIVVGLIKRFILDYALEAVFEEVKEAVEGFNKEGDEKSAERYNKVTGKVSDIIKEGVANKATDFAEEHLDDLVDKLKIRF